MRLFIVIGPKPLGGKILDLIYVFKLVLTKPIISNSPVETFDIRVLLRLPGLKVCKLDAVFFSPSLEPMADRFRTIITAKSLRLTSPFYYLFQKADTPFSRQGKVYLNAQSLTIEIVNHIEEPIASAIFQLVMHEIHGPDVVDRLRLCKRLRLSRTMRFLGLIRMLSSSSQ